MLRELNEYFPLAGQILTADALHTQDDFAKLAREELNAHFVLTVKGNRKNLYAALEALCWAAPPGTPPGTRATAARRPAATSSWTPPRR